MGFGPNGRRPMSSGFARRCFPRGCFGAPSKVIAKLPERRVILCVATTRSGVLKPTAESKGSAGGASKERSPILLEIKDFISRYALGMPLDLEDIGFDDVVITSPFATIKPVIRTSVRVVANSRI
jgi:hypothetical protein